MHTSWTEIRLDTLRNNIRQVLGALNGSTQLIYVIKADGYGHGIRPVARAAAEEGVRWFGVAYIHEALAVREVAPAADILVMGVVEEEDVPLLARHRITPVVVSVEHGRALGAAAVRAGIVLPVHVKLDTGMGRLGIDWREIPEAIPALVAMEGVRIEGLCSHFATVEPDRPEAARKQVGHFQKQAALLENALGRAVMKHLSSSRAFQYFPEWDFDAVRPGILLYGYGGSDPKGRVQTAPILQWKSRVAQVRDVPAGFSVGYYGTHVTERPTRLAVLALGYADGYLRTLSNRGHVLVEGRRSPVIGRVTMNWITIDLGPYSTATAGSEVVMIGEQCQESIWAGELARHCRTIPYEIVTGIHPSIRRVYLEHPSDGCSPPETGR